MARTIKSLQAEIDALKAAYEGMPTRAEVDAFSEAYQNNVESEADNFGMTQEEIRGVKCWARMSVDMFRYLANKVTEKNFVGFSATAAMVSEYSHIAFRGAHGRTEHYTKRRQEAAHKVAYLDDATLAKVEAVIAEKETADQERRAALKQEAA